MTVLSKINNRNYVIDIFRMFAIFFVICCHVQFPNVTGEVFKALARWAVPFFFVISGYFIKDFDRLKIAKHIKKIFILTIFANLFYFVWDVILVLLGSSLPLVQLLSKRSMFMFLVFNESPFAGHLWFLGALLYSLVFMYVISYIKPAYRKYFYLLIPILLIGDLLLGKYSVAIFHREFYYIYIRNFIFVGIPYTLLGNYIYTYKDKFISSVKSSYLIFFILLFSGLQLVEKYFLIYFNLDTQREHFISTTFLTISIFLLCLKSASYIKLSNNNIYSKIIINSSDIVLFIYIIHWFIINIFYYIFHGNNTIYNHAAPIIIFIVSLILYPIYKIVYDRICILINKLTVKNNV